MKIDETAGYGWAPWVAGWSGSTPPGMLRLAREQVPAVEFVQADARALPEDFGPFEAVTAFFLTTMRDAGLLATDRVGRRLHYARTPLGEQLSQSS